MKTIDYSQNDNTFIISDYHNTGSIKIFQDGRLIYNSNRTLNEEFNNVSFTHDTQNVVVIGYFNNIYNLLIVPLENVLDNNIFHNNVYIFTTDRRFLDFETSKNDDIIAIYFNVNEYYTNSSLGRVDIPENKKNHNILQVYNYIDGQLLFEKISLRNIIFSLSELNTIAIAMRYIDNEEPSINRYELSIYDLVTHETNNIVFDYEISFIKYLPELIIIEQKLLIITREPENIQNLKILDVQNNFSVIYNKPLGSDTIISCVEISNQGQIAIGTSNGLLYLDFSMNQDEDRFEVLFNNLDINSIVFSGNGNRIKIASNEFSDVVDTDYLEIHHHNLLAWDHDPDIEDPSQEDVHGEEIEQEGEIEQEELQIADPQLDLVVPYQPPNHAKLSIHSNDTCHDLYELSEQNIGNYLSSSPDNIVIFYKNPADVGFLATCSTFEQLKKFLKDPNHVFYSCVHGKDPRTYHMDPPQYLKIPTGTHTIFVNYQDIKQKYMQRQNMIFLEYNQKLPKTITYDASYTMAFVSSNHCQDGSVIDLYRIIF